MSQIKFEGTPNGSEGTITKIYVKVGDDIKVGQALFELEIEKTTETINSQVAGKISALNFKDGGAIKSGDIFANLGGDATKATVTKDSSSKTAPSTPVSQPTKVEASQNPDVVNERPLASHLARSIAHEKGIDLRTIQGTGPAGRVLRDDILKSATTSSATPTSNVVETTTPLAGVKKSVINVAQIESFGAVEKIAISPIRKAVANAMVTSKYTAPHVTVTVDIDGHRLSQLRDGIKTKALELATPVKVTFLPFFVKAVCVALKEERFKLLNSTWDEANNQIIVKKYYNIGMAADTDRGLVVPVVFNADKLSLLDIATTINDLGTKAKKNALKAEDMRGGSFTITNFGSAGIKYGTPVINYPEVAILGLGAGENRAVQGQDGKVEFHMFFPMSLSIDHRVIDGAPAGYFLNRIKELIEQPEMLLSF